MESKRVKLTPQQILAIEEAASNGAFVEILLLRDGTYKIRKIKKSEIKITAV